MAVMVAQAAEPQKHWNGCLATEDEAELTNHRLSCKSSSVTSTMDSSERGRTTRLEAFSRRSAEQRCPKLLNKRTCTSGHHKRQLKGETVTRVRTRRMENKEDGKPSNL